MRIIKGCEIFIRKIKQKIRKNIKEYKQKKTGKNSGTKWKARERKMCVIDVV